MAVSRMRGFLIEQARQAEERGHSLTVEHRPGPDRELFWAVCSCGYSSTRRNSHGLALGAAFAHVGDVLGESHEAARNGVSLPGSVRPAL